MQNNRADIRHQFVGAAMTSKARLQLPCWKEQSMAIDVFHVHKKVQMRANDQVRSKRLALTARDLAPHGFRVQNARTREAGATTKMMGKVDDNAVNSKVKHLLAVTSSKV